MTTQTRTTLTVSYTLSPPQSTNLPPSLAPDGAHAFVVEADKTANLGEFYAALQKSTTAAREKLGEELTAWRHAVGNGEHLHASGSGNCRFAELEESSSQTSVIMSNVDILMHDALDPKGSGLPSHSSHDSITEYTEEAHRQMDKAVAERLEKLRIIWRPDASFPELAFVLQSVIDGDTRLACKYLEPFSLLKKNELLLSKVAEAWKTGWYSGLRRLGILRAPVSSGARLSESKLNALGKALTSTYRGCAVDAFHQYLKNNNTEYRRQK
ncbi:hypothetical protein OG21DRAFT_1490126 [Imleria badia]|nr:hypothetical protein OG21DRAFT_1490126 [Imleria badia]